MRLIINFLRLFSSNARITNPRERRETYGNVNVGRQITVDITLSNGDVFTCRLDNLVKKGNTYQIIDAKSSITTDLSKLTDKELRGSAWSTDNQIRFYDALENGNVQSITPRGQNAIDYFKLPEGTPLPQINITNSIEFLVNDVATDGYKMYSKIFNF